MAYFQEINGFSSDIRRNCTSSRRYTCCASDGMHATSGALFIQCQRKIYHNQLIVKIQGID